MNIKLLDVIAAFLATIVCSANAQTISFSPGTAPGMLDVQVGDTFTLTLTADFSAEPTLGGGMDIMWDASGLSLVAWSPRAPFVAAGTISPGQIDGFAFGDFEGFTGPAVVGEIAFQALATGLRVISMDDDSDGVHGPFISFETFGAMNVTFLDTNINVSPSSGKGTLFSFDSQGPTRGALDHFGSGDALTEGDILTVGNPGAPGPNRPALGAGLSDPGLMVLAADLGVTATANGYAEVDALSFGQDYGNGLRFSVDEFATGISGGPGSVFGQGALGAQEAAGDIFVYADIFEPVTPSTCEIHMVGSIVFAEGGDGMPRPGLGLVEPTPADNTSPDLGDNLDAFEMNLGDGSLDGPIFFSLDSTFDDPLELSADFNTGTASSNGFVGGDVLVVSAPGATPVVFATADELGLDRVPDAGEDSDDLDALSLLDTFNDQEFDADSDEIYFSVRRGSSVIGQLDSRLGCPIEPGDVLTVPLEDGMSNYPQIVIPAEAMGLKTERTHFSCSNDYCDDLDGLDRFDGGVTDSDEDGVSEAMDNCVFKANADQRDTDDDGFGNACDPDLNNDCQVNFVDLGMFKPDIFMQGDLLSDFDGNGFVDFLDLGVMKELFFLSPGPAWTSDLCDQNPQLR